MAQKTRLAFPRLRGIVGGYKVGRREPARRPFTVGDHVGADPLVADFDNDKSLSTADDRDDFRAAHQVRAAGRRRGCLPA